MENISANAGTTTYNVHELTRAETDHNLIDYYNNYKSAYDAAASDPSCQGHNINATCAALNQSSGLHSASSGSECRLPIPAPLLDITPYGRDAHGLPNVWLCNTKAVLAHDLEVRNMVGKCNGDGTTYLWGFSFHMLLVTSASTFIFIAVLYGLWAEAEHGIAAQQPIRRFEDHDKGAAEIGEKDKPSILGDAMRIAAQVEAHYGAEVKVWDAETLKKRVWKGSKGIQVRIVANQ